MRRLVLCLLLLLLLLLTAYAEQDFYWDLPQVIVDDNADAVQICQGNGLMAIVWQEYREIGDELEISFHIKRTFDGTNWEQFRNILPSVLTAGERVSIYSMRIDTQGQIYIAVSVDDVTINLYTSRDSGASFRELSSFQARRPDGARRILLRPRLFLPQDEQFFLFVTVPVEINNISYFYLYFMDSRDGINWSPLREFSDKPLSFFPSLALYEGAIISAYQVYLQELAVPSNEIYSRYWNPLTRSWSEAVIVSHLSNDAADLSEWDNQRPHLYASETGLRLSWERRQTPGGLQAVYTRQLDFRGYPLSQAMKVNLGEYRTAAPRSFTYKGKDYISWFNDETRDRIYLAQWNAPFWDEMNPVSTQGSPFLRMSGQNYFPTPIIFQDELFIAWENDIIQAGQTRQRVALLVPDTSVQAAGVSPVNFQPQQRMNMDTFRVRWNVPFDPNGIAGFAYLLSRDADEKQSLDKFTQVSVSETEHTIQVQEDGLWYFHLRTRDKAGNWSVSQSISFYRDTTPPPPVEFDELDIDEDGFLVANTYTFSWTEPDVDDFAGYVYRFDYLGSRTLDIDTLTYEPRLGTQINKRDPRHRIYNVDNGTWALSVAPVDTVGNVGEIRTLFIQMDKYVPVTYITRINTSVDLSNIVELEIIGRGFSEGGNVQELYLDRDGLEPYDYTFTLSSGLYSIQNDRRILGPKLEDIEEGVYRVGLRHPERGIYFTRPTLALEATGTVKIGRFDVYRAPEWSMAQKGLYALSTNTVLLFAVLLVLLSLIIISTVRMGLLLADGVRMRNEANYLLLHFKEPKRKERIQKMKKRGMSLRYKFAFIMTALVILIILMVSIPLSVNSIQTQSRSLAEGLEQNAGIMLDSLAASASDLLNRPSPARLNLSILPGQIDAWQDALYITVTGYDPENTDSFNTIWATNDPDVLTPVVNVETEQQAAAYIQGESQLLDDITNRLDRLAQDINSQSRESLGELLLALSRTLASYTLPDADLEALGPVEQRINEGINAELRQLGNVMESFPQFLPEDIDPSVMRYEFFTPIVYIPEPTPSLSPDLAAIDTDAYRGSVRIGVSTERILGEIQAAQQQLILQTIFVAIIAIALGLLLALILASIIIRPINALVEGVKIIRDTENQQELANHNIAVKTGDELQTLADTINQMTYQIYTAAVARGDLTDAKEIQKKFISLDEDSFGKKRTTAKKGAKHADFFGYYEGAKGVSGDYFDFQQLDEDNWAIIKCDVAGKGAPASLIMVVVATMFLNYFREWRPGHKINLANLVGNMNALLEERGFQGRFAALMIIVLNTKTRSAVFCHAGDKALHWYNQVKKRMEIQEFSETPAAGVFSQDLLDMQGGYKQYTLNYNKGDTLFLFTDGVEEAQRVFRDESFNTIRCEETGLEQGELHDTHPLGNDNEELGNPRIHAIINAVYTQGKYILHKYHNPIRDEDLEFDFSELDGTVDDAVLALIAVEKIFRIYPDPQAGKEDRVVVDKTVDIFLEKTFNRYDEYFVNRLDNDKDSDYIIYTQLKEDQQYDDLTVLAVRMK